MTASNYTINIYFFMFSTNTKNIYEFKDTAQVLITQEHEFINLFQNKCKPYYF